jgi:hypothetical protein
MKLNPNQIKGSIQVEGGDLKESELGKFQDK